MKVNFFFFIYNKYYPDTFTRFNVKNISIFTF